MADPKTPKSPTEPAAPFKMPDPAEFSRSMSDIAERSQRIVGEWLKRQADDGPGKPDPLNIGNAFMEMTTRLMANPAKMVQAQIGFWQDYMSLWQSTARRMIGMEGPEVIAADPKDKRFRDDAWKDNEVEPSPVADDSEWMRRVHLDICGHIPSVEEVEKFIADKDKAKRTKLIDRLLDDPAYTRNWTTVWTNLCIGQQTPRRVSRDGMQKFFREAFGKNRPWKDVVSDLVTAEAAWAQTVK